MDDSPREEENRIIRKISSHVPFSVDGDFDSPEKPLKPNQGDLFSAENVNTQSVDLDQVLAQKFLTGHDARVRKWNVIQFCLSIFACLIMVAQIWVAYDEAKCWPDTTVTTASADRTCLFQDDKSYSLKVLMSVIVAIQLLVLAHYYKMQLKAEQSRWHVPDSVIWRQYVYWFFGFECLILLVHPVPLPGSLSDIYNDKLGVLMFTRLYQCIRVLRDFSPIYRQRHLLLNDPQVKKTGAVDFNWLLAVKFVFLAHKWRFVTGAVLVTWSMMAYSIWIFEREVNRDVLSIDAALWLTTITMTTVGYGDIHVKANWGRVFAGIAALTGITLTAMLTFAVMDSLSLTAQDTRVKNLYTRTRVVQQQRITAARYLQLWWKHHLNLKEVESQTPEWEKLLKLFNAKNTFFKGVLRKQRRILSLTMELDDLVIERLEDKMTHFSLKIANRLSWRFGLRPRLKSQCLSSLVTIKDRLDRAEVTQEKCLKHVNQMLQIVDPAKLKSADDGSFFGLF
eukprot:TRINITY_DN937_c0_g1_i1.p1 TRINITY_DN937_c0_g1~~TRINITY_DN937_c0_g1_i1.p1  ORF type:complete len:508 (-),score=89.35 TRINITY_DN937_c0_g1_i1:249-1772(-)